MLSLVHSLRAYILTIKGRGEDDCRANEVNVGTMHNYDLDNDNE